MNLKEDRFFPARLLSKRNRATVQEKESVLKAVFEEIEQARGPSFRERLTSPRGIVVTVLAILLLTVPLVLLMSTDEKGTFTSKGSEASAFFDIRCLADKQPGPCREGDKIVFRVVPPINKPYLSVFAKHRSSGAVIWYFPGSDKEGSLDVGKYLKEDTFTTAIKIGAEHAVGLYDVYGIFTDRAMKRSEIRGLMEEKTKKGKSDERAKIFKRTLNIE